MTDKSLVKRRFAKSLKTYDDNALAQKKMAVRLIKMLPRKEYENVFEIGCSTGILTKEIKKYIKFKNFFSNDIVEDCENYINKIIIPCNFKSGDIEEIELKNKYDLIISNACLQWCCDIEKVILKLFNSLDKNGTLAFSIFAGENLKEIKKVFNMENTENDINKLKHFLEKFNCKITEEKYIFEFENLEEVLKHLKYTGANAVKNMKLTLNSLKKYSAEYKKLYSPGNQVKLTYNPLYVVIKK